MLIIALSYAKSCVLEFQNILKNNIVYNLFSRGLPEDMWLSENPTYPHFKNKDDYPDKSNINTKFYNVFTKQFFSNEELQHNHIYSSVW